MSQASVSQTVWATDPYLQIFFTDPNLTLHQFSAQPTKKDTTNSKINNVKSVEKINCYKQANHIPEGANRDAR